MKRRRGEKTVRERLCYAILWIVAVIAISLPWSTVNGRTLIGWQHWLPFGFLYVIGLGYGLIVFLTESAHPLGYSLAAGILMFLGVIGGRAGAELMELSGAFGLGKTVEPSGGSVFAFLWSIVFTIAGSILGRRMAQKEKR